MRSYPSCWNKTLSKLGFRRKPKKNTKKNDYYRRRSIFESLEVRQLLSVNSTDDTYVEFNSSNSANDDNYGNNTEIIIANGMVGQNSVEKEGLIKFDLAGMSQDVTDVKIQITPLQINLQSQQRAYLVNDDFVDPYRFWAEDTTTWDDQPDASRNGDLLHTWQLNGSSGLAPIEIDVTAEVQRILRLGDMNFDGVRGGGGFIC